MAKLTAGTKGWIVKLYKAGADIDEIREKVKKNFPKITKVSIRSVVRRHLEALADELWAIAVKVKFGWKCAISNKVENLESHHLIRRGNWTHRWTVLNGVCLNSYFHTLGGNIAAHGATDVTERFREWLGTKHLKQWAWFKEHQNDLSRKPDIDELLKIVRKLEGATKNAYNIKPDLGKREKAEDGPITGHCTGSHGWYFCDIGGSRPGITCRGTCVSAQLHPAGNNRTNRNAQGR